MPIDNTNNISKLGFIDGVGKTIFNIGNTIVNGFEAIDQAVELVKKLIIFTNDGATVILDGSLFTAISTSIFGFLLPDQNSIIDILSPSMYIKNKKYSITNDQFGSSFTQPIHTDLILPNGSTFNTGSDLNSVVTIKVNYTHYQYDGKYFLVDASKGDIVITIPPVGTSMADDKWSGRSIVYKRIDFTKNKVNIVNQRGSFDKRCKSICLKNECGNLAALHILVNYDGEAYLLSKF